VSAELRASEDGVAAQRIVDDFFREHGDGAGAAGEDVDEDDM
jgi:hypothetical protein